MGMCPRVSLDFITTTNSLNLVSHRDQFLVSPPKKKGCLGGEDEDKTFPAAPLHCHLLVGMSLVCSPLQRMLGGLSDDPG